jgi:hypothetical protein
MQLDLQGLAAAVVRNNMGVGGIELRVRGRVQDGVVAFAETDQRLPVTGAVAATTQPWLVFAVHGFGLGAVLGLELLREQPGPAQGSAAGR